MFVGYGIAAPDKGLNEYDGLDVQWQDRAGLQGLAPHRAAAAAAVRGQRRRAASRRRRRRTRSGSKKPRTLTKVRTAYDRGAAAILLYDPDEPPEESGRRRRSYRGATVEPFQPERGFLCFSITERVFRAHHAARIRRNRPGA